jgi:hypothetical protein
LTPSNICTMRIPSALLISLRLTFLQMRPISMPTMAGYIFGRASGGDGDGDRPR